MLRRLIPFRLLAFVLGFTILLTSCGSTAENSPAEVSLASPPKQPPSSQGSADPAAKAKPARSVDGTTASASPLASGKACPDCGQRMKEGILWQGKLYCTPCAQKFLQCTFCHKLLVGRYLAYEDGTKVCAECERRLPSCDNCGIKVNQGYQDGSQILCAACYKTAVHCQSCGTRITGRYTEFNGKPLCLTCYDRIPQCDSCGNPMVAGVEIGQKRICSACMERFPKCAGCGGPITKTYATFPGDERKFCTDCVEKRDYCDVCSLPVTNEYYALSDKRIICAICMKTSVTSDQTARQILQKVLRYLQAEFQMDIRGSTRLTLVNAQTLAHLRGQRFAHSKDPDPRALGLFLREGDDFNVYVESHLPYALCLGVIAHEFTHAWHADQFTGEADILWREGLSEWIAYHALLHHGYPKEAAMIPRQKDEYGQGFRRVQELEKRYGKTQVLREVLKRVNNP